MKFLLVAVNAKFIHSNPAIYSLRACAGEELGKHVELAEYTINQYATDILADIYARKPEVLAFSCYIWNWRMIQDILTELPKILPDMPIWLGGPEVSYEAASILEQYPRITGIMVGEGEATFRELLELYVNRSTRNQIVEKTGGKEGQDSFRSQLSCNNKSSTRKLPSKELHYKQLYSKELHTKELDSKELYSKELDTKELDTKELDSKELDSKELDSMELVSKEFQSTELHTKELHSKELHSKELQSMDKELEKIAGLFLHSGMTRPRPLTNMTQLPFLYQNLEPFENRIIYYESSRGCPYRCSYCLSSIDKRVRLRDINMVHKELQYFLDQKVAQVKFVDRTFNCNHTHAMSIWRYLLEHDNGVTNFHFEISADILKEDEIAVLNQMRPGLVQLEIGVQSTNPETIQAIDRVMNVKRLKEIVSAIHSGENIHQHLDLIAGLPYEDYKSFGHSFDQVYDMKPDQLQLGFLKVLKGSPMYERAKKYGICYQSQPPYEVLYTKWLSYDEILLLKQIEEMVELYYNSNQFTHMLPFLAQAFTSPFVMFEKLAAFYKKGGYFINSPSRAYRYQLLLEFAEEYDGKNTDIYRELLTFDLYLRENMKSRPSFAPQQNLYREKIRNFYHREVMERKYLPGHLQYDEKQISKMTHMEPFYYPVWEKELAREQFSEATEERFVTFVLFDYQQRSPLNHEARTVILKEWSDSF